MNGKKEVLLVVLIIIIALFLRTYQLKTLPPGLYPDEAMDGDNALEVIHTGHWSVFYPENNGREGLFMNIQVPFVQYFGNQPWVLRAPSALFGTLTVLGMYFLGRELFDRRAALMCAFLIATSFWHINFSRISFRAIMAPFFMVWGLYFLLAGYRNIRERRGLLKTMPWFVVGGAVYGLGMHSYIAYRATPLIIVAAFIFHFITARREEWLKQFATSSLVYGAVSLLVFAPLGMYFVTHPGTFFGRTSEVSIFSSPHPALDLALNVVKTAGMFNIVGDFNWRHNFAGHPELFWPVGILFLIGLILGIRALMHRVGENEKGRLAFWIIFSWTVAAALPVVVSNEGLPHALRSILFIPPAFLLAGYGGIRTYDWLRGRVSSGWLPRLAAAMLFLFALEAYTTYFVFWGQNPNIPGAFAADYVQLGNVINKLPDTIPKYVIVEADGVPVHGIPMPATTVMYVTDTYLPQQQNARNVHYVLPDQENSIPKGSAVFYLK